MSCEECKEQVFELIEREAIDPEGVQAILAECPDCREEFEALKASLALAGQLPIEEPPPAVDAAILQQAARRLESAGSVPGGTSAKGGEVVPFRKRVLQTPPWAMAAIALLAVGVGVWSIPREVQFESDAAPGAPVVAQVETADLEEAEPASFGDSAAELDEGAASPVPEAPRGLAQATEKGPARRAKKKAAPSKRSREAVARQQVPRTDEDDFALAGSGAASEAKVEARERPVALRSAADSATSVPATAPVPAEAEEAAADRGAKAGELASCKASVATFEKRLRDERRYEPEPEEQLALGRCYQTLGDEKKARTWLERAAAHPATKERATKALRSLSAN